MIQAEHKRWADWLFRLYLNRLYKQHFYAIYLLDPIPYFDINKPLLLLPNHSSWWDGFFIYLLNNKILQRKIYLMMLEDQLKQNHFFRFLGAYSIKSENSSNVRQSIQYTIDLLNRTEEAPLICFFPQGELQSWNTRPIVFKKGLEFILKRIKTEINLCFLGIRIEFLGEQRPEVFFQFSSVKKINTNNLYSIHDFESEFNLLLDKLGNKIMNGEKGQIIYHGKRSINERVKAYWKRGT